MSTKKITLAFEDNCFCFQVTAFFYQKKWIFIQNVYKKRPLFDKMTYNWKTKAVIFKPNLLFVDIIMLMLLAMFEFDRWFHIFKNKELSKK